MIKKALFVIYLKDERYARLVIEVNDPPATAAVIQRALGEELFQRKVAHVRYATSGAGAALSVQGQGCAKGPLRKSTSSVRYKPPVVRCYRECSAVRVSGRSLHPMVPHADAWERHLNSNQLRVIHDPLTPI
jgi:hypothetical protein